MQSGRQPESPSLYPLPAQEHLLQTAFGGCARVGDAFVTWKQQTGFKKYSDIDFSSSRLLPAAYHNLRRRRVDDPWMSQMAALHRYHWLRNIVAQNQLLEAVQCLQQAGCECLVLGGFALAAGKYFDDPGERPLLEGELLVSVHDASAVRRALTDLAWSDAAAAPAPVAGWRSEWWRSPRGPSLRIHYRWLPKTFPVLDLHHMVKHAVPVEFGGVTLLISDPGDLLVYACVANRRPAGDLSHRFLWVANMLRILERGGDRIDWDRLQHDSRETRTLFPLREALAYLANTFGAKVPQCWLDVAWDVNIRSPEKRPFLRATRQWPRFARSLGTAVLTWPWNDYAAAEQVAGRPTSLAAFAKYWRWHLKSEARRLISSRSSQSETSKTDAELLPRAA